MTPSTGAALETGTLWRPLRSPTFRNLLLANVASDMGTFMQAVGAAWLMVSLNGGPMYVALIQTASALPFFVFALPAGAIGDIFDRRRVILTNEIGMAAVAAVLAAIALSGKMTPGLLLVLTFLLATGDAFESPTWRAVLPELVQKKDLSAASALNGIEFNFARAVGPALGGVVVASAGVGAAFLINALSFLGVIVVIARWKRIAARRTTPPETIGGATVAALRYVRFSPAIRTVMLRVGSAMFFASALMALLPSLAHRIDNSAIVYGALLGAFGCGAVLGALLMQKARAKWSADAIVPNGIALFGLTTLASARSNNLFFVGGVMLIGGASWISFVSLFNVQVLNQAPDWVRARVLAITMLVFQGAVAAGSAVWGAVAAYFGLSEALLWAGVGALLSAILGSALRLPEGTVDLTPWIHWPVPEIVPLDAEVMGPVLVTVEYRTSEDRVADFIDAMREYGRLRRRDGASRWGLCRDAEIEECYLETFVVSSWAEHLRQHSRSVAADRPIEERLHNSLKAEPSVRHFLYL